MYCRQCGNYVPDDAAFCTNCGAKLTVVGPDATVAFNNSVPEENMPQQVPPNPAVNPFPPDPGPQQNPYVPPEKPEEPKRKSPLWLVIAIEVIAIIVVIVAIFMMLRGDGDTGNSDTQSSSGGSRSEATEDAEAEDEDAEAGNTGDGENAAQATPTPEPTPIPTSTPSPVPTEKIVTETSCRVTDAQPSDLGNYRRLSFASANASSSLFQQAHPDYDNTARSIIDNDYITSWQDGSGGNGTGESITLNFDSDQKVKYLEFRLGNWRTDRYYNINPRPRQITMTINGKKYSLEFTDAKISHYVDFDEPLSLKTIDLYIDSVYTGSETGDCCIAEITAYAE